MWLIVIGAGATLRDNVIYFIFMVYVFLFTRYIFSKSVTRGTMYEDI